MDKNINIVLVVAYVTCMMRHSPAAAHMHDVPASTNLHTCSLGRRSPSDAITNVCQRMYMVPSRAGVCRRCVVVTTETIQCTVYCLTESVMPLQVHFIVRFLKGYT
jgi:hypothetical protein